MMDDAGGRLFIQTTIDEQFRCGDHALGLVQ
jgi:hypothetical protein